MKTNRVWPSFLAVTLLAIALLPNRGAGAVSPATPYLLLHGSTLIDECPPCARPTVPEPMRGRFTWRLLEENPLFSSYALSNISFTAGSAGGREYRATGHGTYTFGGEVAVIDEMFLEVWIDDGFTNRLCYFTNTVPAMGRRWPLIDVELAQTNGTLTQVYGLHLLAAPVGDLWFSTAHEFTSSRTDLPTNHVSAGDLLSFNGNIVHRNTELTARLGLLPGAADPGLDAVAISTNGETLFSLDRDVFSDVHGWVRHGDLLSNGGRLVRRNGELSAAFAPMPSPAPADVGLDAVQELAHGEIYFSIETNLFSERLGVMLSPGDVLSDRGVVVRTHDALLARFHPPPIPHDYGLDALHVWPSGEIWFSLEEGFQDDQLGTIQAGDVLSDEGQIVFRNLDLLKEFAPIEDLADFGLDGLAVITNLPARPAATNPPAWHYSLVGGSQLTDDCPVCDRIPIVAPMTGGFDLRRVESNTLFSRYAVQNLSCSASWPGGKTYNVSGHGTYQVGGEIAIVQQMFLELLIDDGVTRTLCYFTNVAAGVEREWPMLKIELAQTNGTLQQTFFLDIAAAPLREIWYSTTSGFHPGAQSRDTNYVSGGDLITSGGRVVSRNHDLTARLGIMPAVPEVGLDAADVLPGGEIAFSIEQDIFSESLGPLHEGDVLSDRGRVLHGYTELVGAFSPEPPVADQGLDALQALTNGDLLFSVERSFFSETLGRTVGRGDLLSSAGIIVKTNAELLARFSPAAPEKDYGLDAVWAWPSGEIWFSVEEGFYGQHFEFYAPGDLLSDRGYVVFRNLELVADFAPLEELADFGLDALFIVTDMAPPQPAPRITGFRWDEGGLRLEWEGAGRVFQLERAAELPGEFVPAGDIVPGSAFTDPRPAMPRAFYRVRQW